MNDVWTDVGKEHPPSYPADQPTEAIDYILTSDAWRTRSVTIPDTQVSDHRPVVADLRLR